MDFITGLPADSSYNAIFVCADKLTKLVRLTPCSARGGELSAKETARLFFYNNVPYYGVSQYILYDRDPRVTSLLCKALFEILGNKTIVQFSVPSTNRQLNGIDE